MEISNVGSTFLIGNLILKSTVLIKIDDSLKGNTSMPRYLKISVCFFVQETC